MLLNTVLLKEELFSSFFSFLSLYSCAVDTLPLISFHMIEMHIEKYESYLVYTWHTGVWFGLLPLLCRAALGGPGGLSRGEMSLAEVQCHLDKEGASDLVIDLIMNTTSDRVFQESILLAIALLEGGNTTIQVS